MHVRGKLEQQEHCGQYQQQPHHHHPANENKPQKKLLFRHEISRLTCRSAFGCPSMTCKILHLKIKGINHLDLIEEKRTVSLFSRQVEFSEAIESLLLMFKNCFYGIAFSSDKQAQAKPKIGYKEECFFTEQEYGQIHLLPLMDGLSIKCVIKKLFFSFKFK